MQRPEIISNLTELEHQPMRISRTGETLGLVALLGERARLESLRIQHEILPPGHRSSSPHAHTKTEEFVYVLEGHPDLWLDGELYPLRPGDCVAFAAGTGMTHVVINNADHDATLLSVAALAPDDACFYPHNPVASSVPEPIARAWAERPRTSHSGLPDRPAPASGATDLENR